MGRRLSLKHFLFFCLSLNLGFNAHAENDAVTEPSIAGTVESIMGKKTLDIKGSAGNRTVSRGDKIQSGDTIATDNETVVLILPKGNELQIAPHTTIQFEEVANAEGKRDVMLLQNGIIWGLVAVGHSLSDLFYLRTAEATIGIPAANFVVEYIPGSRSISVLTLEGNAKVASSIGELSDPKKCTFVSSTFRSYIVAGKIGKPKKFKRNLLISYLARKAKDMAQDMTNRGNRLLSGIAKKQQPTTPNEDEITWNNLPAQSLIGNSPNTGAVTSGGIHSLNNYRGGVDTSARVGTSAVSK